MKRVSLCATLLLMLTLFCRLGQADVKFGPEFNFTNQAIIKAGAGADGAEVNNDESEKIVSQLAKFYTRACLASDCKVEHYQSRYDVDSVRVTFADNWFFEVETDPSVIEVKTSPMTLQDINGISTRMSDFIFKPIYKLGLKRANDFFTDWAGGHIHVDIQSAFGDDLVLFRNFIVDYTNHVELAHKIFNDDKNFAPSVQVLDLRQKTAFDKLIKDTDSGKIASIRDFALRLERDVYYKNPFGHQADKHQALNVTRITNEEIPEDQVTLELRAFRSQESPAIFALEAQLIEKRIDFLKRWRKPIGVRWLHPSQLDDQTAVSEFYRYVKDCGLSFDPYLPWVANFAPTFLSKAKAAYRPVIALPFTCVDLFQ